MKCLLFASLLASTSAWTCSVRPSPTFSHATVMRAEGDAVALSAQRELSTALSKARRDSEQLPDLTGGAASVASLPGATGVRQATETGCIKRALALARHIEQNALGGERQTQRQM